MYSTALQWVASMQSRCNSLIESEFCSHIILFFLFLLTSFRYKLLSCRAEAVSVAFLCVSWHMKIEGSLVFKVLREVSKANGRISTADFRKEDFWLFQGSAWQDPMSDCPEDKGAQEGWLIFKDNLFKGWEQSLPTGRKRSKHGRRPAQNKEFMTKLNAKRKYTVGGR